MAHRRILMEPLEGRTLLAATPSPVILADQQQLALAAEQLTAVRGNWQTTLAADRRAIATAWTHNPAQVSALLNQYRATLQARQTAMAQARLDLLLLRGEWAGVLRDDTAAVLAARNDPTQLALARKKLSEDRIAYRRRILDATANVTTVRFEWRDQVRGDYRAVVRAQTVGGSQVRSAKSTYQSHLQQSREQIGEATRQLQFARQQLARDLAMGL